MEKRKYARFLLSEKPKIKIECNFGNNIWLELQGNNICLAGLGAELDVNMVSVPLLQRQYVCLKIMRNGSAVKKKDILITGQIVWCEKYKSNNKLGLGIHFERLENETHNSLKELIDEICH